MNVRFFFLPGVGWEKSLVAKKFEKNELKKTSVAIIVHVDKNENFPPK